MGSWRQNWIANSYSIPQAQDRYSFATALDSNGEHRVRKFPENPSELHENTYS